MNKWLASVQSLEEAQTLISALPDILDMKNPAQGALGALKVDTVSQIVQLIDGRCQTSATIGDLPMQADIISAAMINMAASNVNYLKIGLFPDHNLSNCIANLAATVNKLTTPVIAVVFADKSPDFDCWSLLKASGFHGVMVDTAIKNGNRLLAHWGLLQLRNFVIAAHQHGMLCGLAGALRYEDIKVLQPLGGDYLGFRSALCLQHQRTATIDLNLAKQILSAIRPQAAVAISAQS